MTRPTIAVDIDGVIANQVHDLLRRVKEDYGIDLAFEDINEYNPPIGPVDFWHVITEAQKDFRYLRDMPPFPGAADAFECLQQYFRVGVVTARPDYLADLTEEWLDANRFYPDFCYVGAEGKKHLLDEKFDFLIEDYPKNVQAYLDHCTDGVAVLLERPWNHAHGIQHERLLVARDWFDLVFQIGQTRGFRAAKAQSLNTAIAALG